MGNDKPVRAPEPSQHSVKFLLSDWIAAFMPFDEPVSDAHRLINAKKHDQESKGKLDGQLVT